MKIIIVENNIVSSNQPNPEPWFYLKPDSAILKDNHHFYYPDFADKLNLSLNLAIKTNRLGKNISPKYANRYYNEITAAINFFAGDKHNLNKGDDQINNISLFDNSLPLGTFVDINTFADINNLNFMLLINDKKVIKSNSSSFKLKIDELISFLSKHLTIKIGDYIISGIHVEEDIKPGDTVKAVIEDKTVLSFKIR